MNLDLRPKQKDLTEIMIQRTINEFFLIIILRSSKFFRYFLDGWIDLDYDNSYFEIHLTDIIFYDILSMIYSEDRYLKLR